MSTSGDVQYIGGCSVHVLGLKRVYFEATVNSLKINASFYKF